MARQRGSVKKLPNGQFVARYSAGADPLTGKRLQAWKQFPDRKEAQQWLTAELSALDAGARQRRVAGGPTLAAFLRTFYTEDRRGLKGRLLSPRTCEIDLDLVERYVIRRAPAIAATPVGKLTTEVLSKLFRLLAAGDDTHQALAKATVARVYRILAARLTHAQKLGDLRANPMRADLIPVDGKPARAHRTLNPEQAQALLAVCLSDRYGVLFALIAWTGLRPGEAAGLTWDDIDLEGAAVMVRRALVRTKGKAELRGTKTGRVRRVPIPSDLVAQLKAHRKLQAAEKLAAGRQYDDTGLVFATRYGKAEHLDNLVRRHFKPLLTRAAYHLAGQQPPAMPAPSRSLRYAEAVKAREAADAKVIEKTGFPDVSLYELRHTQATLLLRRGVHPKIVADRMGHARTSTTLDIYSHVTPDMQDKALAELEEALGGKKAAG
jgi:integrase